MWLFTPDGFFSAVQHKDDPDKIMIRTRARLHAQKLVDACPDGFKPELVETPPPADYRFRVTVRRETWIFLVAKFAAEIAYLNFKNEAATRQHPPGFMSALHGVWSKLLGFQDSMHDDSKKGRWSNISHGGNSDPFVGLNDWLGRREGENASDDADCVELAEGMIVQMIDDEGMGDGEVLSVDDEQGTALVHFATPTEDGTIEEDVLKVPIGDLMVLYDPLNDDIDDIEDTLDETAIAPSRPETETFDSMDDYEDDGSWPPPEPAGWLRGR